MIVVMRVIFTSSKNRNFSLGQPCFLPIRPFPFFVPVLFSSCFFFFEASTTTRATRKAREHHHRHGGRWFWWHRLHPHRRRPGTPKRWCWSPWCVFHLDSFIFFHYSFILLGFVALETALVAFATRPVFNATNLVGALHKGRWVLGGCSFCSLKEVLNAHQREFGGSLCVWRTDVVKTLKKQVHFFWSSPSLFSTHKGSLVTTILWKFDLGTSGTWNKIDFLK